MFTCPILQLMTSNHIEVEEPPTVKIKISGDGARMSHSSSLFVCSFSLLEEGQHVLSSAGRVYCKLSISAISTKSQAQHWKSNIYTVPNNNIVQHLTVARTNNIADNKSTCNSKKKTFEPGFFCYCRKPHCCSIEDI